MIAEDKTTEQRAHCFKHLSKSASELDSRDSYTNVPQPSPSPQRNGRTVAGVLQRTHGFLSTLKVCTELNGKIRKLHSIDAS